MNFTLTTDNYYEVEKAYLYARERNISFSVQFAVPWENAQQFNWSKKQLDEVKQLLHNVMKQMVKDYKKSIKSKGKTKFWKMSENPEDYK